MRVKLLTWLKRRGFVMLCESAFQLGRRTAVYSATAACADEMEKLKHRAEDAESHARYLGQLEVQAAQRIRVLEGILQTRNLSGGFMPCDPRS